jgi:hypothetical protein
VSIFRVRRSAPPKINTPTMSLEIVFIIEIFWNKVTISN